MKTTVKTLFFVLLFIGIQLTASAQQYTLSVDSCDDISYVAPLDMYNTDAYYCRTQWIIPFNKLTAMQGKVINELRFHAVPGAANRNVPGLKIKVKLAQTTTITYPLNATWLTENGQSVWNMHTVRHAGVALQDGILSLKFDVGYLYTSGNLVIELENTTSGSGLWLGQEFNWLGKNYEGITNYYYTLAAEECTTYPANTNMDRWRFCPWTTFVYSDDTAHGSYYCSFETEKERQSWIGVNGLQSNIWRIGDLGGTHGKALFISNQPESNNYDQNSTSVAYAYTFIDLEPNTDYLVSYDWRCDGDLPSFDYMHVALVPYGVNLEAGNDDGWSFYGIPNSCISLDDNHALLGYGSWQHKQVKINTPPGTSRYRLVVLWRNNYTSGYNPPAAIDNIQISPVQKMPMFCTFDEGLPSSNWVCLNGTSSNGWCRGTAASGGFFGSLYISNNGGTSNACSNEGYETLYTYTTMRLKPGTYMLTYEWKCTKPSSEAFIHPYVVPASTEIYPNESIPYQTNLLPLTANSSGGTVWNTQNVTFTVTTDTLYKLAFAWQNFSSSGSEPGAISNVSLSRVVTEHPWSEDFTYWPWDQDTSETWTLANGLETNYWMRGSTDINGQSSKALYITDDGNANHYDISERTASYAFTTHYLESGDYDISYKWHANGESTYDFLRAALVPTTMELRVGYNHCTWASNTLPEGAIAIDGGHKLNGDDTGQQFNGTVTVPESGYYRLAFLWRNDASSGDQRPAAIDNVQLSAHVTIPYYTITVQSNNDWGTVCCGGTFPKDTVITLTATANNGYHFVRWHDNNADNPRYVTVTGNATYLAYFDEDEPSGIDDTPDADIKVFPNPASSTVTVSATSAEGAVRIALTDLNGRQLMAQDYATWNGTASLDVSTLAPGVYMLQTTTPQGSTITKIVIER